MTSNGDSAKQIWITEEGAPSEGPDGVGQAAEASALTQAIADARSTSWIGALYMYSWQDYLAKQLPFEWQPFPAYQITEVANNLKGALPQSPTLSINPENWYFVK